jgi:HPt (histidine-containing phosphotransfer) domain-containing protein
MIDFQKAADELGFDLDEYMEIVDLFMSTAAEDMERLRSGIQGKEIDFTARAAHSLKGAAANLGFETLAGIAGKAETFARGGHFSELEGVIADLETEFRVVEKQISDG